MLDEARRHGGSEARSLDSLLPRLLSTSWSASSAAHHFSRSVVEQVHDRFESLTTMQKVKCLLSVLHMRGPQLAESKDVIQKILDKAEATVEDDWVIRLAKLVRGFVDHVNGDFLNAHGVISCAQVDGEFLYRLLEVMDAEKRDLGPLSAHQPHDLAYLNIPSSVTEQSVKVPGFVLACSRGEKLAAMEKEARELLALQGIVGDDLPATDSRQGNHDQLPTRQTPTFLNRSHPVLESNPKKVATQVAPSEESRESVRVVPEGTDASNGAHEILHQALGSESPVIAHADSPSLETLGGTNATENRGSEVAEARGSVDPECPLAGVPKADPECPVAGVPKVLQPCVNASHSPKDVEGSSSVGDARPTPSPPGQRHETLERSSEGAMGPSTTPVTVPNDATNEPRLSTTVSSTRGAAVTRTLPPAERAQRLNAVRERIAQQRDATQRPKMVCMALNEAPSTAPSTAPSKKARKA